MDELPTAPTLRTVLEQNGRLLTRQNDRLADPSGQLYFDFATSQAQGIVHPNPRTRTSEEWFELGYREEEAGRLNEAVSAYQQALLIGGPDADVCYNLATVLATLGRKSQAAERFRQAVEVDRRFAEAWNGLGVVLEALGQLEESLNAYRTALQVRPGYADAHYNLADLLDTMGRPSEACPHWQAYLSQDATSKWANHASQRLSGT
jgi:tetratricopeptide (TPR) repeat protein